MAATPHPGYGLPIHGFACLAILLVAPAMLRSQPAAYAPRGVRAYLVNYGAMDGDYVKAWFAAKRFAMVDEGSRQDIALIHRFAPGLPVLHYRDMVALAEYFDEYQEVTRDESAFMHAADPALLTVSLRGDTASMAWLPDRRGLAVRGYHVWNSLDSAGSRYLLTDSVIAGTRWTGRLPKSASWISISTVLEDGSDLNYGYPSPLTAASTKGSVLVIDSITTTRSGDTVRYRVGCSPLKGSMPDSVVAVVDRNRNNTLDTLRERLRLRRAGTQWVLEDTIVLDDRSGGGFEFYLQSWTAGERMRLPREGMPSNHVNNRVMNDYYAFYVMNVGSSTWRRHTIDQILTTFASYGYNGLFEDDTWYRVESWAVDASPLVSYDARRWQADMNVHLDSIRLAIAPRPAYFNGLYAAASDSLLLHADGGMSEGFAYTHWSGYQYGTSWKMLCDIGLRAQHTFRRTWLALGGAPRSDPDARLYTLASYLLAADTLSMFANATSYQEFSHFPEFDLPLGRPLTGAVNSVDELRRVYAPNGAGYYLREYENGTVVVNPNASLSITTDDARGRLCASVDTATTLDGSRLFLAAPGDSIGPRRARIYMGGSEQGARIASPIIEDITVTPDPVPADGSTTARIRVRAREDSDARFLADSTLPLWITAHPGALGAPRELHLANDGSYRRGVSSWYEAAFTIPEGAPPGGADVSVIAASTSGLASASHVFLRTVSGDSANLLLNYSFEIDGNDDGVPDLWRSYVKGFDYDTTGMNAKSGRRSVHARNDSLTESRGVYYSMQLNQILPADLLLSGWSKAANVSGTKNNDYSLYVDIHYTDGTPLYGQTAQFSTGTHDWEYSERVIHPEKPIQNLALYVLFRNHSGEATFDHLSLRPYMPPDGIEEQPAAADNVTVSPASPNPARTAALIRFTLRRETALDIRLYDAVGRMVAELPRQTFSAGAHVVSIPLGKLPRGRYQCILQEEGGRASTMPIMKR